MPTPLVRPAVLLAVVATVAAGCGGPRPPDLAPVQITVTLNGQPLPNARVVFTPTTPGYAGEAISAGVTDDSGKATLTCNGKPGACTGPNSVTVAEGPAGDDRERDDASQSVASPAQRKLKNRPIPSRYAVAGQTDLTIEIKAGQVDYQLDLKR
jgi:hypothetical protein